MMTYADVFILGIIIGGLSLFYLHKIGRNFILKRKLKKARRGEIAAVQFLKNNGFSIVGIQEKRTITTWVDGVPHNNTIRVDFLVRKWGKTYIAEVKTGRKAPNPFLVDTRRQLLEYYLAYGSYGILLVDMEKKRMHEISFDITGKNDYWRYLFLIIVTAILGLACGWFLYKYFSGGLL